MKSTSQIGVVHHIRIIWFLVIIKASSTTHVTDMSEDHSNSKHNVHNHQQNKQATCTNTNNNLTLLVVF